MNVKDLNALASETGLSWAYHHFSEGEAPDPPWVLVSMPRSDNFSADGTMYYGIDEFRIELYCDYKDPDAESKVENVLKKHHIFYDKVETWIASERLYETVYTFEQGEREHVEIEQSKI